MAKLKFSNLEAWVDCDWPEAEGLYLTSDDQVTPMVTVGEVRDITITIEDKNKELELE